MEQRISIKPHPGPGLDFWMFRTWFASALIEFLRVIAFIVIFIWLLSPDLVNSKPTAKGSKRGEARNFPKK